MKCYTVDGSGLEGVRLATRPALEQAPGEEVLVEVHAVSLNYRDLLVSKGLYGGVPEQPFIACSDMAGVVLNVGPGVNDLKEGDRVLNSPFRYWPAGRLRSHWARTFVGGSGLDGVLTERLHYPAESLVKVPDHLTLVEASTLPMCR